MSHEEEKTEGDVIGIFQNLKSCHNKEDVNLFSLEPKARTVDRNIIFLFFPLLYHNQLNFLKLFLELWVDCSTCHLPICYLIVVQIYVVTGQAWVKCWSLGSFGDQCGNYNYSNNISVQSQDSQEQQPLRIQHPDR